MDRNVTLLTGTRAGVSSRMVGQQGRTLTELRLNVAKPGKRGEPEVFDLIVASLWNAELGATPSGPAHLGGPVLRVPRAPLAVPGGPAWRLLNVPALPGRRAREARAPGRRRPPSGGDPPSEGACDELGRPWRRFEARP